MVYFQRYFNFLVKPGFLVLFRRCIAGGTAHATLRQQPQPLPTTCLELKQSTRFSKKFVARTLLMVLTGWCLSLRAAVFPLPPPGDDIVGKVQTAVVQAGDDFATIAQHYNVSYYGLIEANPNVDPDNLSPGTVLIVPSRYILPAVPRQGMVINVAELRLYYFPPDQKVVYTYPVGVGRQDWETPLGKLKIVEKIIHPTWYVPNSIREARAKEGVQLPRMVLPGPNNPLGDYALRLSKRTYLIHGTNDSSGVGRRSSAGCIRLYPTDIAQLFAMMTTHTPVHIINAPYKVGWEKGKLYLEAHLPLEEQLAVMGDNVQPVVESAIWSVIHNQAAKVDWNKAVQLAQQHMGLPEVIGQK